MILILLQLFIIKKLYFVIPQKMDFPKASVLTALLSEKLKISPSNTPSKQYYSLPSPVTKYMFENASAINYFKLFQSCKLLNKFVKEKYGPQIDVLEVGNLQNHSFFLTLEAQNKEIKIRGSAKIYGKFPKFEKIWIRKRLMLKGLSGGLTGMYFSKLNLSTVKEVYLLHSVITVDDYKKLLVPSIEILYGSVCTAADEFDIISYTLKNLKNLKVFKLPWQQDLTTFAELTAVKRECKLEKAEIYEFPEEFDVNNLSGFMTEQMSPNSTLYLCFKNGISQSIKNKWQNFADEFNMNFSQKIIIR